MKYKLSDICTYRNGKVDVKDLNAKTYISTENMLPNKGGITEAASLPTVPLTQGYKKDDVLVSNIRPYFKKIWRAKNDIDWKEFTIDDIASVKCGKWIVK